MVQNYSSFNWKLCSKNLVIQVIPEKLFWLLSIFCKFFKLSIRISCFLFIYIENLKIPKRVTRFLSFFFFIISILHLWTIYLWVPGNHKGYIMNLVVLIIPFIVYCVKMYVYKLNMRDKIWFICLWYCILTTTVPVFIYLIILFIVNICKPLWFPGTQR
jgi:hypothetical protein